MDELELPDEEDFTRRVEINDLMDRLRSYVNALPADTQRVFRLKFFGGYTFAEIASMLSVPESSAKSKYYRLINLLKKEFEDECD